MMQDEGNLDDSEGIEHNNANGNGADVAQAEYERTNDADTVCAKAGHLIAYDRTLDAPSDKQRHYDATEGQADIGGHVVEEGENGHAADSEIAQRSETQGAQGSEDQGNGGVEHRR